MVKPEPNNDALHDEVGRLQRAVDELSILNELARAISSSFATDRIIQTIIDRSARAVQAAQATVTVVNPTTGVTEGTIVRVNFDTHGSESFHVDENLLGWMFNNKQPLRCNDIADCELPPGVTFPATVHSLICVPLLVKGELTGVLAAYNKQDRAGFDAADQRLLAIIATQSAQVLETARLLETEQAAERMGEQIRLAGRIQQDLLPPEPPRIAGYELAGCSIPAQQVGGDYYDFLELENQRYGVCLGDVSGKGLPASLLMANLQATFRGQVLQGNSCSESVRWSNRLLFHSTAEDKFATLFYAVLDTREHTLTYCNAGHDHPFHFSGDAEPRRLATGGLILGILETYDYRDEITTLAPGDLVVIYSDGVTDMLDAEDEQFGEARLIELLRSHRAVPAAEVVNHVVAAVQEHAGTTPAEDDLTLVVIKREVE